MKTVVLAMLGAYKRFVSPALPNACRFVPTCSEYAMEAVDGHGVVRGAMLTAWRLLRCHPLARGGYDPVPANHLFVNHQDLITVDHQDLALRRCSPTLK